MKNVNKVLITLSVLTLSACNTNTSVIQNSAALSQVISSASQGGGSSSNTGGGSSGNSNSGSTASVISTHFVYVSNKTANMIFEYGINPTTGALSPIVGNEDIATASNPMVLTLNPAGTLLYSVSYSGIDIYSIDSVTGALSLNISYGATPSPTLAGFNTAGTRYYVMANTECDTYLVNATTGDLILYETDYSGYAIAQGISMTPGSNAAVINHFSYGTGTDGNNNALIKQMNSTNGTVVSTLTNGTGASTIAVK